VSKLYVGIDISKDSSSAHGINESGKDVFSLAFSMNASGFDEVHKCIGDNSENSKEVVIAMESTACYHINLYSFLSAKGIEAVIVNPLLIANYARLSLRKTKTDKKDARTIAHFLLSHKASISQIAISQDYQDIRDISRERESISHQISATMVEIRRVLHTTFPELEGIRKPFSKTMLYFLKKFPSARLIRSARADSIIRALSKTPCSSMLKTTPKEIIKAAKTSVGTSSVAKEFILAGKIETLEHLKARQKDITMALVDCCESVVIEDLEIVTSITGISNTTATSFLAEMGHVSNYSSHKKLIAYAGIDPTVYQSGKYEGASRISNSPRRKPYSPLLINSSEPYMQCSHREPFTRRCAYS
jgi:transposase